MLKNILQIIIFKVHAKLEACNRAPRYTPRVLLKHTALHTNPLLNILASPSKKSLAGYLIRKNAGPGDWVRVKVAPRKWGTIVLRRNFHTSSARDFGNHWPSNKLLSTYKSYICTQEIRTLSRDSLTCIAFCQSVRRTTQDPVGIYDRNGAHQVLQVFAQIFHGKTKIAEFHF